jgi:hypothetical protein
MIIALAGRRVDSPDTDVPRFPLANVNAVAARIRELLHSERAQGLVSSAACGADLIAQTEAGRMGIRRRVVLPFAPKRFVETSVIDRPGDWAEPFDEVIRSAEVVDLAEDGDDSQAYAEVNRRILDEAERLAGELDVSAIAVLVWDGSPRGKDDLTSAFRDEAQNRGLRVLEVKTT